MQQLTLSLILSPLLQVTHLVTPQCQYTPKFLTAIAKLVPVVSPAWEEIAPGGSGAWPPGALAVPDERNHRFFVREMREFPDSVAPWASERGADDDE